MKKTADVVIIGGGIQGTSLLFYLTERGICNVQLIEMNQIGDGATSRSAAWVMHTQDLEQNIHLTKISMREFLQYGDKLGVDIGLKQPGRVHQGAGSLSIGTKDYEADMRRRAALQRSHDIPTDILTAEDIKRAVPFINVSDVGVGLYCQDDAIVDPHSIMYAYIKRAKARGAQVAIGVRATGILLESQRVVGVETTAGRISAPVVVNAAGFRAREVGESVGISIPLCNSVRHELITAPTPILDGHFPLIEVLAPEEMYIGYVGTRGNQAMIGIGRWEPGDFEQRPNLFRLVEEFGDALRHRFPELYELEIVNHWAGIRPLSPDGYPVLGPVENISGYVNDCCWGGDGVAHAPAGGVLVSGYIAEARDMPMSIEPFLLKRF